MKLIQRAWQALAVSSLFAIAACATNPPSAKDTVVTADHKAQVVALLKSFETGEKKPLAVISETHYTQHNLHVPDGKTSLVNMLGSRPVGSTKVNTVRVYQDGNYVFSHTEYDFGGHPVIGFDVFRFEGDQIVEHWDNLQPKADKPSPGGHTMTDGPTVAVDLDKTAANKALMQTYMDDLLQGRKEKFTGYFDGMNYIQHSPLVGDNLTGLFAGLQALAKQGLAVKYDKVHMVLGEGNFVLVMAEGSFGGKPTSYYDFYRLQDGKIAEHWDTLETILPPAEWKNANGKY